MLPALAALKGVAAVDFVGRQPGLGYIGDTGCRTMDLESAGWHRLFADHPPVSGRLSLPVSKADQVVAFFKDKEGIIRKNLEFSFPNAPVSVFPAFPPRDKRIHVARYLAECLESAGLPVSVDRAMEEASRGALFPGPWTSKNRHGIVFHPGSGGPSKNHPPDFWIDILRRFQEMGRFAHLRHILLLGPAENHLRVFFENHQDTVSHLEIIFYPKKELLMNILGSAAFCVGHDSGVTHLSGLMGTPTVAFFKQTDPVQWGPLGPYVRIIHRRKADGKLLELFTAAANELTS